MGPKVPRPAAPGAHRMAVRRLLPFVISFLYSARALAYLASPPDSPPVEILTFRELKDYADENPALKDWLGDVRRQVEEGKRRQEEEERARREGGGAQPLGAAVDGPLDALGQAERRRHPDLSEETDNRVRPSGGDAMQQLQRASGARGAADAPPTGSVQEIDPIAQGLVDVDKLSGQERIKAIIHLIAVSKGEASVQQLYEDYLQKVYFGGKSGNTATTTGQVGFLRKGIEGNSWSDFPTAAHGEVPPGAAATWSGGHITMAPGLNDVRIFDHEMIHHADSGHGDGSPIGVNENSEVEGKTSYGNMGCAPGMGSSNGC